MNRLLTIFWIFAAIFLLLYSFTQVDLGLTLTRASFWQVIQKSFQYIGYFNRPLSAVLFGLLILLLYGLYGYTIKSAKNLTRGSFWKILIPVSVILFLSYNAFSYDLFNYIFDAKIVTFYNENPYLKKALDYPTDPMLGFMHWTHRTYPYGPMWLAVTVPLSFLGAGYFLITFYLFKILMLVSFLGSVYFLEKILGIWKVEKKYFLISLFALNPLVLVESLVSAHNDIVMMFFGVLSVYLLLSKRKILAILFLVLSIGVKFATVFLFPAFVYAYYKNYKKQELDKEKFVLLMILGMVITVCLASFRTNFQPWYLLFVLPLVPLLRRTYISVTAIVFTLFALVYYIPFLYTGNWNEPIPTVLNILMIVGLLTSAVFSLVFNYNKKRA